MIELESTLIAAKKAQYSTIKNWLMINYAGGNCQINKWEEFRYGISSFLSWDVAKHAGFSTPTARYRLLKLVEQGEIELLKKHYKSESLRFRFSRAECDEMAEMAIKYWQSCGYDFDKIVPRQKDKEPSINWELVTTLF